MEMTPFIVRNTLEFIGNGSIEMTPSTTTEISRSRNINGEWVTTLTMFHRLESYRQPWCQTRIALDMSAAIETDSPGSDDTEIQDRVPPPPSYQATVAPRALAVPNTLPNVIFTLPPEIHLGPRLPAHLVEPQRTNELRQPMPTTLIRFNGVIPHREVRLAPAALPEDSDEENDSSDNGIIFHSAQRNNRR